MIERFPRATLSEGDALSSEDDLIDLLLQMSTIPAPMNAPKARKRTLSETSLYCTTSLEVSSESAGGPETPSDALSGEQSDYEPSLDTLSLPTASSGAAQIVDKNGPLGEEENETVDVEGLVADNRAAEETSQLEVTPLVRRR